MSCTFWYAVTNPYGDIDAGDACDTKVCLDAHGDVVTCNGQVCYDDASCIDDATCGPTPIAGSTMVAITVGGESLYALDDQGFVWSCEGACDAGFSLLGNAEAGASPLNQGIAATGDGPAAVVAWTTSAAIYRDVIGGVRPAALDTSGTPEAVAIGSQRVYWTTQDADGGATVKTCDNFVGMACPPSSSTVNGSTTVWPNQIAAVGDQVAWASQDQENIYIAYGDMDAAPFKLDGPYKGYNPNVALASDGTSLYWAVFNNGNNPDPGPGIFTRQPPACDGGANTQLVMGDVLNVSALFVRDGSLYWAQQGLNIHYQRPDASAVGLAVNITNIAALAANTSTIFILAGGIVYRMPQPP